MNSYNKSIIWSVIVVIVAGSVFLMIKSGNFSRESGIVFVDDSNKSVDKIDLENTFEDVQNRFSFSYPEDYTLVNQGIIDEGETILVQKKGDSSGLQIYITSFDELGTSLTVERIQGEIPEVEIRDARDIDIDGVKIGITFVHGNDKDAMREVWFAKNGFLYQISAFLKDDNAVQQILSSWNFN